MNEGHTRDCSLTVVSSSRLERSRVVPDGTTSDDKTIVAHDFWLTLASEAPDEPEKVQLVALLILSGLGAGVMAGAGSATGEAITEAVKAATSRDQQLKGVMLDRDGAKDESRQCLMPRQILQRSWSSWHLGSLIYMCSPPS